MQTPEMILLMVSLDFNVISTTFFNLYLSGDKTRYLWGLYKNNNTYKRISHSENFDINESGARDILIFHHLLFRILCIMRIADEKSKHKENPENKVFSGHVALFDIRFEFFCKKNLLSL